MQVRLNFVCCLSVAAMAIVACGGPEASQPSAPSVPATPPSSQAAAPTPSPPATPDLAAGVARRTAYINAICPPFETIALLDPRLAALRSAGASGGDMTTHAPEVDLIAEELRVALNELEAVPDWTHGRLLRNQVITAIHELRTALIIAGRELGARDAAERLAAVPYIARPSLDLGMQRAVDAGFECSFGAPSPPA